MAKLDWRKRRKVSASDDSPPNPEDIELVLGARAAEELIFDASSRPQLHLAINGLFFEGHMVRIQGGSKSVRTRVTF